MPSSPIERCRRHSVLWLSVRASSHLTQYLINLSWKFHRIYNFRAVGNKDELIKLIIAINIM